MGFELRNILAKVTSWCREIENRAPGVLVDYRRRLEGRVRSTLTELGHATAEVEVLREVVLFSDRSDIREEVVRLSSHLEQVGTAIQDKESQGKRLDFLIQEMVRETNTIGFKANDSAISHFVVEIKTAIEQMREIVQNVE